MLEGLINLVISNEIIRTEARSQEILDAYHAEVSNEAANANKTVITYDVSVLGKVEGDLEEFRKITFDTLTDPRGWARAGVVFEEVPSGGRLHMYLASAEEVVNASPLGCAAEWSCTVKPGVYINDTRWMYATDTYNNGGGTLLGYRQMVINHEVGHFLGHDHLLSCEEGSGLAPIMMQQSIDLHGCAINPWPISSELWTSGL